MSFSTNASARELKQGQHGKDVTVLQQQLQSLSYLPRAPRFQNGVFGYATFQAVIAFQKIEGIGRDGTVGPKTQHKLARAHVPNTHGRSSAGHLDKNRLEILRGRQVVLIVRKNKVKRTIAVSTGRPGLVTSTGSFRVYMKDPNAYSYIYHSPMPLASFFDGGIALHEYEEVPAYSASHGCVRVPVPFAAEVYRYAPVDEQVLVLPY